MTAAPLPWPPPPGNCSDCGEPATAAWGAAWSGSRLSCPRHDPLAAPGFTAGPLPTGFWYRSLGVNVVVPHTTGHLAVAIR